MTLRSARRGSLPRPTLHKFHTEGNRTQVSFEVLKAFTAVAVTVGIVQGLEMVSISKGAPNTTRKRHRMQLVASGIRRNSSLFVRRGGSPVKYVRRFIRERRFERESV